MSADNQRVSDQSSRPAVRPLPGKLLGELVLPVAGGEDELLRHRFLCRKGSALLIASTGVGKSVLALQWAIAWSLGKASAGIEPARTLRIWIVQGENCEGDIAEQRDGVLWGLLQAGTLTAEECETARTRVRIISETHHVGRDFGDWLSEALQAARDTGELPDMLIIDPAFSFLGGDASSQADVSVFLRNIINPLLDEFALGLLLVHHGNKPALAKYGKERTVTDFTYAGAGSAEWCNWARATLVLEKTETRGLLILHAGKNGHKLGWRDPVTNEPIYQRHLAHAADGRIYWREPDAAVIAAAQACTTAGSPARRQVTVDDVSRLADVPRGRSDFEVRVETELKIGRDKARNLIRACIDRRVLEQADVKSFPRQTLIGLPGVTAAEAARRAAGAGAATTAVVACLSPAAPVACPPAAAPTAPAARPKRLQI